MTKMNQSLLSWFELGSSECLVVNYISHEYSNLLQRCFDLNVQGVKYSSEAKSPICGSLIVRFWRFSSVYSKLPTWRHGFLRLSHYDYHHLQLWKGAEKFKAGQGGVQCSNLHRQSTLALENYLRILSRFHDGI